MTAAKDSPQQPIEGEAGGNPLDEVLMPPETLGQRIHADGERFRAGFGAGRDSVFLSRIAEAAKNFDADNPDEATYEEVRDWIFEFADAMDLPYGKNAGVVSVAVAVGDALKDLSAPPNCSCIPPDVEDEFCGEHGRTPEQWREHVNEVHADAARLSELIDNLAVAAGLQLDEFGEAPESVALRAEARIKDLREEMDLKVDLEPGNYWMTSFTDGRGPAIVTNERRLLVAQFGEDGTKLDGGYSDLTGAYTPGTWKFEPRQVGDE